jgi:hypothetical protein
MIGRSTFCVGVLMLVAGRLSAEDVDFVRATISYADPDVGLVQKDVPRDQVQTLANLFRGAKKGTAAKHTSGTKLNPVIVSVQLYDATGQQTRYRVDSINPDRVSFYLGREHRVVKIAPTSKQVVQTLLVRVDPNAGKILANDKSRGESGIQILDDFDLSIFGRLTLGKYLQRVPAVDTDGGKLQYELVVADINHAMPANALSVDKNSGDLYICNAAAFPSRNGVYGQGVRIRDSQGRSKDIVLMVNVELERQSDTFTDLQINNPTISSTSQSTSIDLRPTSVSAAGNPLQTSLFVNGRALGVGETYSDTRNGYEYGVYKVLQGGCLGFVPNPTLYKDKFAEFKPNPNVPGTSFLERPAITLVLVEIEQKTNQMRVIAKKEMLPQW